MKNFRLLSFFLIFPIFFIPQLVIANTVCQADLDRDGIVDIKDYSILAYSFSFNSVENNLADITQDGFVNILDYTVLASFFFQRCHANLPSPVPTSSPSPSPVAGTGPRVGSCQVFPNDNPWNQDISKAPVHSLSAAYISSIGATAGLHPDFGGASYGEQYGIPFSTVTNQQPLVPVSFVAYGDESDPGPYPIPTTAPIEGGTSSNGDRHVLVVNTDSCILYELFRAFPVETSWTADSGAIFDLSTNAVRPKGWTSADAAGLPILSGLVRFDEVSEGKIEHAIRFTAPSTQRGFIFPARHFASNSTDPSLPPMGLRLRLKASYDTSGLTGQAKVIATALKKYGLILADNGGRWFFQGEVNDGWIDSDLDQLKQIRGTDFEAVDTGPIEK